MAGRFSVEAVFKAADRITAPIAKMQARMKAFTDAATKGVKDLDRVASGTFSAFAKGAKAVAAASVVAGVALGAAAQPGIDFEQQMANLGATSLQTRDQIAALEKEALRLGASTQFSATEVGAAMENMAKAGFDNEQILGGIAGMVNAAAAAGEDLAKTTETVSSVMKGMGLATSESTRVADVLALASVRTDSSILSLGESMANVSSTARQLNVPLEDVVAMVALLQDVGLDASEAGSAMTSMLTELAKPSAAVAKQMKKMGVSFKDSAGNMLAPAKVLAQLVKAGEKAGGNMDQVAFFADLVGMRGQKAATNLKDLFAAGKVTGLVGELENAGGIAKKMSDLRMNTFAGDLDVFKENVKSVQIELFTLASGSLRSVTQGMSTWVDKNKEFIVSGIVDTVKWFGDHMEQIAYWTGKVATMAAVWFSIAAAIKVASAAMAIFNAIATANPLVLTVMAIVGALMLITAFWPEISKFFGDLWALALDVGSKVVDGVALAISQALTVVGSIWDAIKAPALAFVEFMVGIVAIGAKLVMGAVSAYFAPLIYMFTLLAPIATRVATTIGSVFVDVFSGISDFVAGVFQSIAEIAGFAADKLKAIWEPVATWFSENVVANIKAGWSVLSEFFSGLWTSIKDVFWTVLGPVFDAISWAVSTVRGIGQGVLGTRDDDSAGAAPSPQVVSVKSQLADYLFEESRTTAEVTIKDQTGRAQVTKAPKAPGFGLTLTPSGAM